MVIRATLKLATTISIPQTNSRCSVTYKLFEATTIICALVACIVAGLSPVAAHLAVRGVIAGNEDTLIRTLGGHFGNPTRGILALCRAFCATFGLTGAYEDIWLHGSISPFSK